MGRSLRALRGGRPRIEIGASRNRGRAKGVELVGMRNTGSRRARTITGAGAAFAALVAAPAQAADGLVLVPEATLLVVLLVAFTLLVFPVNALVFKPLFRVLALREERIAGARRRALELERDAADVLAR